MASNNILPVDNSSQGNVETGLEFLEVRRQPAGQIRAAAIPPSRNTVDHESRRPVVDLLPPSSARPSHTSVRPSRRRPPKNISILVFTSVGIQTVVEPAKCDAPPPLGTARRRGPLRPFPPKLVDVTIEGLSVLHTVPP